MSMKRTYGTSTTCSIRRLPSSGGGGGPVKTVIVPGLARIAEQLRDEAAASEVRSSSKPSGRDEWQKEIARLQADDPGMTTREIAELMHKPHRTTLRMVMRGVREGRYIKGRAMRSDSIGRLQCVPVYRRADTKEDHK